MSKWLKQENREYDMIFIDDYYFKRLIALLIFLFPKHE